jgi:ribosomal protein L31
MHVIRVLNKIRNKLMRDIHPNYEETTITCACGNKITTRSTKKDVNVEICSSCHPFFTGKQKLIDSGGRVDRFKKRLEAAGK